MKADRIKHVRARGMIVFALVCLITMAVSTRAQGGDPAKASMQDMDRRELQLNNLGRTTAPKNDSKRAQALMDQVREDFQRILTLHNELVRTITKNGTFGSQYISDAAGEIKKRSMRLQSSLKLAKPEGPSQQETHKDLQGIELRDRLILLCRSIENFVTNPIIEKPGTVDARLLEKARSDLQSMVEVSEAIKKEVDKKP